ncbi:dolichol monophosphate mannose synthase [Legionella qingyii]|uniref:Dolichol monophosphate mannose synthase n=1 Tax=Legionella qingyii TaxID=2184757 RepID=A0A317U6T9_9GAMM|nr:glycosyltransferase family 39 protein [Legionella qingyii]PWY56467.1 dolichol monophosphate mannose synthase [Legionella qingyii]PWY57176.1 dolichol monophosphate mannose synthase [Legionella qingyii]RUR24985.1 glycosyltransferase family 39 protein [Legionella qingyii]
MLNQKVTKPFLIIYISFLFLATFFIVPTMTSFYYYAWGKHLAWSYFDGPPMIAYFFHISRAIFGDTFFSINIIGFLCLIVGAYYIYRTGCLLHNQQTGLISALIWVVLPTTTESILVRVLYDAPLNLFTILSFYFFARYISYKRILDVYLCALFIGAMILSKYTAVVSVLGLLLYVIFSKQRQLFKSVHFYLACLTIILMVSPVIYWNIKHDWISITYLLHFHSQTQNHTTIFNSLLKLISTLLINYSVFLLLTVLGWFKYRKNQNTCNNPVLELTYAVLFVGLLFWFISTLLGGSARAIYLTPLGMNIALATGYFVTKYNYHRFFKISYPVFLVFSLVMIVINSWPIATYMKKGKLYTVLQQAIKEPEIIKKGQPVVAGYYTNAAALNFFMPNESVHAIPCDEINQYQYWDDAFLKALSKGEIDKITYFDFKDTKQCPEQFFNQCQSVATLSHLKIIPVIHKLTKPRYLYVYECSSPRMQFANAKA